MRFLMKFGGTSVADAHCIGRKSWTFSEQHRREGHEVAVVVSAQRGVTDQLIEVRRGNGPTAQDDSAIGPDPVPCANGT